MAMLKRNNTGKKSISVFIIPVIIVLLGALAFLSVKPLRYSAAERLLREGNYRDARIAYTALGNYRNSAEQAAWCAYSMANEQFNEGDYAGALKSYAAAEYKNSAELARECELMLALEKIDSGDFDSALEELRALDGYSDSEGIISRCILLKAEELMNSGDFGGARIILEAISDTAAAQELERECSYLEAEQLMAEGRYTEAATVFQMLSEYGFSDSGERLEEAYEAIYISAKQDRYCGRYAEAMEKFGYLDGYMDSSTLYTYVQSEKHIADNALKSKLLSDANIAYVYDGGISYVSSWGYIFVPYELNEDTSYMVYFAGGLGFDTILWLPGVVKYFKDYTPNAICIYYYNSGYNNMPRKISLSVELLMRLEEETGVPIRDVITVGSSHGCYTALHAAADMYTLGGIKIRATISLDVGSEWNNPALLSDSQIKALAEQGTAVYLLEQKEIWQGYEPIRHMVELGADVTVIECDMDDHNMISENAYNYGVFSWGVGSEIIMNPNEYIFYKVDLDSFSILGE